MATFGGCDSNPRMVSDGPSSVPADGSRRDAGSSGDADSDAHPIWEDGLGPPQGYAEPVWETVLPITGGDTSNFYFVGGAVALSTGIVAVISPDLFLVDKADGHIIAHGLLPVAEDSAAPPFPLALVKRSSGDLTILAKSVSKELLVIQYSRDDLSMRAEPVLLEQRSPAGVMAEVSGKMMVYTGKYGEDVRHLHIVSPEVPGGNLVTKVMPDIADIFQGTGAETPGGRFAFCSVNGDDSDGNGYAEMIRIDPDTLTVDKLRIGDWYTNNFCQLFASDEGLMAVWDPAKESDPNVRWTYLSLAGNQVLADYPIPLGVGFNDPVTYFEDRFVLINGIYGSGYNIHTIDPKTGAVTGPYRLSLQFGERSSDYSQAVASDGQSLYAVIAPVRGNIPQPRIQKLAPLPQ
ncbi:MAG TPA: hypothetical protein VFG83_00855, partial [Kofleriaceae bacterium]|nr:hypothetical protein [Kofleriaceae bacterium]